MAQGEIRIKIGAVQDRSVDAVFGNVEKRAQKARDNINRALGGTGSNALGSSLANMGKQAEAAARQTDKAWSGQLRALNNYARLQDREWKRSAQERIKTEANANKAILKEAATANRARLKDERETSQAIVREFKKQVREREQSIKAQERDEVRTRRSFAERTSHRATRFLFPPPSGILGSAHRMAGDMLRGAGVDLSIGGATGRAVELQTLAQQISNQGYRAGDKGPAGTRVEGATLEAEARKVGGDLSLDPHELLKSQMKFLDVTGDLDASRKNMKGLAEIAAASNTDFTAMAEAAGNVSRHLEETPDKAEKLLGIMRVLAGQGKVGSIEIKDFASQMAKIAALAPKFHGDVGENITKLTTIAQLSRAEGGSATAAQAATATARFADVFKSGARMKKFTAAGINPYVDGNHTELDDPFQIIRKSLIATKGDALKMGDLFKSVMAQRGIDALTNAYNKAGGGKAGIDAVNGQFSIFGKESAMTKAEVEEDNAKRQQTIAAKAQKFQNDIDKVVASAADKVFPALEKLAPPAVALAEGLAKVVGYVAENPIKSVILALVAAVGRAGLESALRAAIEKQIMGSGGLLPGRGLAPDGSVLPGGSVWGTRAGRGLMALGAGASGYALGGAIGQVVGGEGGAQTGSLIGGGALAGASLGGLPGAVIGATLGGVTDQAMDLGKVTEGWGGFGALLSGGFGGLDEYQNKKAKERRAAADAASPNAANAQPMDATALSRGVADGMAAKTLQVKVVNAKDFASPANTGPRVDNAGRAPR
jgi:hypothetical protein